MGLRRPDRGERARPLPLVRTRGIEVFGNRFGRLFNDEVVSPHGAAGRYLRWQWSGDGVVVVPRHGELFALVPMFRYPIGGVSLEFPRGGRERDEPVEAAALRELCEEAGLVGGLTSVIGRLHPETGLIENGIDVVSVAVPTRRADPSSPEAMESVGEPIWMSRAQILEAVAQKRLTCGITLAALALVLLP